MFPLPELLDDPVLLLVLTRFLGLVRARGELPVRFLGDLGLHG
jgi:hypothetical protein